jgi:GABA(A) receptor-associated protein
MKLNINNLSFEDRVALSTNIKERHPDRIPIIIRTTDFVMNKYKFLSPNNITIHQLLLSIRKSIEKLKPHEAVFLFINNSVPNNSSLISEIYNEHKDRDGLLYITLTKESVFGYDKMI